MWDKKGLETLTNIILIILVAAILILFIANPFTKTISENQDRQQCYASVLMKSRTGFFGQESEAPLNCKTMDINSELTDEIEIKKGIADELYWCYRQFGSGKVDFAGEMALTKNVKCFICDEISFSEKTQKDIERIEDFYLFLNSEDSPSGVTYAEYILNQEDANFKEDRNDFVIDTDKTYGVAFILEKKNKNAWDFGKELISLFKLEGVEGVIGTEPTTFLILSRVGLGGGVGLGYLAATTLKNDLIPGFVIADYEVFEEYCDDELYVFEKVDKELG